MTAIHEDLGTVVINEKQIEPCLSQQLDKLKIVGVGSEICF
jgi:hypothetical protein